MENIKNKSLDEIRYDFLFTNKKLSKEEINSLSEKILEEEKKKNPQKFEEAYDKLNSIININDDLPFRINKQEIYELVKNNLLELKALIIAFKESDIRLKNPVSTLNDIKIYTLLYDYLKNDKDVKVKNKLNEH